MLDMISLLITNNDPIKIILLSGAGILIVNILTHHVYNRYDFRAKQKEQVERNLKPLLSATADLISRIVEIIILQKAAITADIKAYDPAKLEERLLKIEFSANDFNRHETTAYRLINFLAHSKHFTRETSKLVPFPLLDRAEYFVQHKHIVAMKGNLYNLSLIPTEQQDDIASLMLDCCNTHQIPEISTGKLLRKLKDKTFPVDHFKVVMAFFNVSPPNPDQIEAINKSEKNWKHTLALAHFGLYLIDFYQELASDPQWEEHRVYFVSLIRHWNSDALKRRYLYEPDDLWKTSYFSTYPSQKTSQQSSHHFITRHIPGASAVLSAKSNIYKYFSIKARGSRYGKRHHPKSIRRYGVVIHVKKATHEIRYDQDLQTTLSGLQAYLKLRLLEH